MVVIKHNDQGNIQKKGFFGDLVFHRDTFISVGREVLQQPLGIEAVTAGGHIFQPHIWEYSKWYRYLSFQILSTVTNLFLEDSNPSTPKQHHQMGKSHSNAWDCGGHIQTTIQWSLCAPWNSGSLTLVTVNEKKVVFFTVIKWKKDLFVAMIVTSFEPKVLSRRN